MKRLGWTLVAIVAGWLVLGWLFAHLGDAPHWVLARFVLRIGWGAWPLIVLARGMQIVPHAGLVGLLAAPAILSLGSGLTDEVREWVLALDLVVVLVAAWDLRSLPADGSLSVVRETGRVASLDKPQGVNLILSNRATSEYYLILRDGVPPELTAEPAEMALHIGPRSRTELEYKLRPTRRGAYSLFTTFLRVRSRWGIWNRVFKLPVDTVIHVYPDLKQLSEYALLARTNRLNLMGLRRSRQIGQDNEFERLRDYTLDDHFKHIDWRATARRNRLTVRDFQANQSQTLVFLIDTGRMMTNEAAGLSLLDHALNSMLLLSYVALQRGDKVGLLLFSDEIHAYIPPAGGRSQMNRLLHAAFDRFPRRVESRYDEAFVYLNNHCRKRSLVILITNVVDAVNALQIERHLATMVGRHLPLGVLLRDRRMFDPLEVTAPDELGWFTAAAAADLLAWRHQVLTDLQSRGVLALDSFPEHLTAPLVNRYLEIKARHLL